MSSKPVDTAIVMVVGPCIDDTDFKSLEESIAYDAAGMDVSMLVEKTDGTSAVTAITLTTGGTSDWTHKDGGYYEVEITAAQNAEEGIAYLRGVCTGVLPFESPRYDIVKANIYDSLVKGTDVLQTDLTQIGGVAQSATDLKDFADAGYDPTTNKVQGVVLTDTCTTNTDMRGTDNASLAATALSDAVWTAARAGDIPAILNHADYGLAKLLRSTTPANTLDVAATGEAAADAIKISGDSGAADNVEATYDGTGYTEDAAPATQEQVGRLTSGSAAVNTTAESFTKSGAEPETNTYTSTYAADGICHIVEDIVATGITDAYYQFDVGGNGVPVSIVWQGYAQGNADTYAVYAYNYDTTSYEQIGKIDGLNGTTIIDGLYALTTAHVGTGADLGKVRFRLYSTDGSAFATDRVLCSYAVVTKSAGYSDGAIWIDTNASNTNTEDYVDGTADNPVSTWTAAKALSTSMGIDKFHVANGSTLTMDTNCDNCTFVGHEWTIALGGQSFENTHIEEATVSGIGTSGAGIIHFRRCLIGSATLGKAVFNSCGFNGTNVVSDAATYIFARCYNAADGSIPPVFDYGAAIGNTHGAFRNWQGSIEVANLGASGTDVLTITGVVISL